MAERDSVQPAHLPRYSRRQILPMLPVALYSLASLSSRPTRQPEQEIIFYRPKVLGATIAVRGLDSLGLDRDRSTSELLELNLDRYRFAMYWNLSEDQAPVKRGDYNFDYIKKQIELAEQHNLKRVSELGLKPAELTVVLGIFSLRVPEYHLPRYIWQKLGIEQLKRTDQGLDKNPYLIERYEPYRDEALELLRSYPSITEVQNQNEATTGIPSTTGGVKLGVEFFIEDTNYMKDHLREKQELLVTSPIDMTPLGTWGINSEDSFDLCLKTRADSVASNFYSRIPLPGGLGYYSPLPEYYDRARNRVVKAKKAGKRTKASEVQAEPWENGQTTDLNAPSASPEMTVELVDRLARAGYDEQLLWEGRWWSHAKRHGDNRWFKAVADIRDAPIFKEAA